MRYTYLLLSFFMVNSLGAMDSKLPQYALDVIKECEQGHDINTGQYYVLGFSRSMQPILHYALYRAATSNKEEEKCIFQVIKSFLDYKADPTLINDFGDNALHTAIQCNSSLDVIEMLLQKVDPNSKNTKHGQTTLHTLLNLLRTTNDEYKSMKDMFQLLLTYNANPCVVNYLDQTTFHYISLANELDWAKPLIYPNEVQKKTIFTMLLAHSKHKNNWLQVLPKEMLFKILIHSLPQHLKHYISSTARKELRDALRIVSKDIKHYEAVEASIDQEEPKITKGNTAQGFALEKGNKELANLLDPNQY